MASDTDSSTAYNEVDSDLSQQVANEFAEAQGAVTIEDSLDFDYSVRDQEVALQSPSTQIGTWVHENPELFEGDLSPGLPGGDQVDREVTVESPFGPGIADVRADAVDWSNPTVYEIKPDNPAAVEQGLGQAAVAADRLSEATGDDFSTQVVTYDRDQLVENHPWMQAAYPESGQPMASEWDDPVDMSSFASINESAPPPVETAVATDIAPPITPPVTSSTDLSV